MVRELGQRGLSVLTALQVAFGLLTGCGDEAQQGQASIMGAAGSGGAAGTQVQLTSGALQGKLVGTTREFLGIPYAQPPVGALRFAPPEPAAPWMGVREATEYGASCPQSAGALAAMGPMSEDCLTLNVFVPAQGPVDQGKPLPVMVFIHGGAFTSGGSMQYRGDALSSLGPVILVTINYRLGALGFFSHPALDATRSGAPSGSDGIRDQQLALSWVQQNIAAFGGDPSNVTVFGESAGSMSACIHLVSPSSQALRQRLIMESGACVGGGLLRVSKADADATGSALASELCAGQADVLACLRALPVEMLVGWGATRGLFGAGWSPVVEGPGGVLPDAPEQLLAAQGAPAPFMIGTNKNEWGLFQLLGLGKPVSSLSELSATITAQFGDHASEVAAQYMPATDAEANDAYVQIITDLSFRCPTRALTRAAAGLGGTVYAYSFEQGTAYHAQELDYVFGTSTLSAFGGGPPSQVLTQTMQRYWTSFAISGVPSAQDAVAWPRYDAQAESYLTLVDPPQASVALAKQCDFWVAYVQNGGTIKLQ